MTLANLPALYDALTEMIRLTSWAALILAGRHTILILEEDRHGEMDGPFDGQED